MRQVPKLPRSCGHSEKSGWRVEERDRMAPVDWADVTWRAPPTTRFLKRVPYVLAKSAARGFMRAGIRAQRLRSRRLASG